MTTITRAERRVLDRLERDLDDARREGYSWLYRTLLIHNAALTLTALGIEEAAAIEPEPPAFDAMHAGIEDRFEQLAVQAAQSELTDDALAEALRGWGAEA